MEQHYSAHPPPWTPKPAGAYLHEHSRAPYEFSSRAGLQRTQHLQTEALQVAAYSRNAQAVDRDSRRDSRTSRKEYLTDEAFIVTLHLAEDEISSPLSLIFRFHFADAAIDANRTLMRLFTDSCFDADFADCISR